MHWRIFVFSWITGRSRTLATAPFICSGGQKGEIKINRTNEKTLRMIEIISSSESGASWLQFVSPDKQNKFERQMWDKKKKFVHQQFHRCEAYWHFISIFLWLETVEWPSRVFKHFSWFTLTTSDLLGTHLSSIYTENCLQTSSVAKWELTRFAIST